MSADFVPETGGLRPSIVPSGHDRQGCEVLRLWWGFCAGFEGAVGAHVAATLLRPFRDDDRRS